MYENDHFEFAALKMVKLVSNSYFIFQFLPSLHTRQNILSKPIRFLWTRLDLIVHFVTVHFVKVYSDFINNFTEAMDVAKTESKRKSAFADFLKVVSNFRQYWLSLMNHCL